MSAFINQRIEMRGVRIEPCGSRVTCNPPPTDTDEDYLVQCDDPSIAINFASLLESLGYTQEGTLGVYEGEGDKFVSFRRGQHNFIVTSDEDFALRHRAATHVCTKLNLLNKADRIMVFQAVLYGNIK